MPHRNRILFCLLAGICFHSGCMKVGPDFVRPKAELSTDWTEAGDTRLSNQSADSREWWKTFNDPALNRLVDRAYRENLSLQDRRRAGAGDPGPAGHRGGKILPADAGGLRFPGIYPEQRPGPCGGFFEESCLLAIGNRPLRRLGNRFLGEVQAGDRIGRCRLAGDRRGLRQCPGEPYGGCGQFLHPDQNPRKASGHCPPECGDPKREPEDRRGPVSVRHDHRNWMWSRRRRFSTTPWPPSLPWKPSCGRPRTPSAFLLGLPPSRSGRIFWKALRKFLSLRPRWSIGIPADLLRRRPDIRSAEPQAAAQCALIGVAKADLFPAFSLSGTFGFLSSDVGQFQAQRHVSMEKPHRSRPGLPFQWNILNYGRITNNVRVQDARFQELLICLPEHRPHGPAGGGGQPWRAFLRAQERADFLAQSAAAAKSPSNLAVLQYREGLKDFTTVLTAQQALLSEQDNLASHSGQHFRAVWWECTGPWAEAGRFGKERTWCLLRSRRRWPNAPTGANCSPPLRTIRLPPRNPNP